VIVGGANEPLVGAEILARRDDKLGLLLDDSFDGRTEDKSGSFRTELMSPGVFLVTVEKAGFARHVVCYKNESELATLAAREIDAYVAVGREGKEPKNRRHRRLNCR
jgi:hypothetical protein